MTNKIANMLQMLMFSLIAASTWAGDLQQEDTKQIIKSAKLYGFKSSELFSQKHLPKIKNHGKDIKECLDSYKEIDNDYMKLIEFMAWYYAVEMDHGTSAIEITDIIMKKMNKIFGDDHKFYLTDSNSMKVIKEDGNTGVSGHHRNDDKKGSNISLIEGNSGLVIRLKAVRNFNYREAKVSYFAKDKIFQKGKDRHEMKNGEYVFEGDKAKMIPGEFLRDNNGKLKLRNLSDLANLTLSDEICKFAFSYVTNEGKEVIVARPVPSIETHVSEKLDKEMIMKFSHNDYFKRDLLEKAKMSRLSFGNELDSYSNVTLMQDTDNDDGRGVNQYGNLKRKRESHGDEGEQQNKRRKLNNRLSDRLYRQCDRGNLDYYYGHGHNNRKGNR